MSHYNIACCVVCQMTFTKQEELSVHSCKQIKIEKKEFEVKLVYQELNHFGWIAGLFQQIGGHSG